MDSKLSKREEKEYQDYVNQVTPKKNLWVQIIKAFMVGGFICVIGQGIIWIGTNQFGLDKELAGTWCSVLLVLTSVILTGFNWYGPIVKFGGAGALVPITGFANSVSSAAIEYKREGQVFGIGSKIFTIAGPVILYGIVTSWFLGLILFLWNYFVGGSY